MLRIAIGNPQDKCRIIGRDWSVAREEVCSEHI